MPRSAKQREEVPSSPKAVLEIYIPSRRQKEKKSPKKQKEGVTRSTKQAHFPLLESTLPFLPGRLPLGSLNFGTEKSAHLVWLPAPSQGTPLPDYRFIFLDRSQASNAERAAIAGGGHGGAVIT